MTQVTTMDSNINENLSYNKKSKFEKNENQKPEKSSDKPKKSVGLLFFIQNLNFE
jgi:hypothetical protein